MNTDNGTTRSLWMDTAEMPTAAQLSRDIEADVCIVGAGMAGLTTAYVLAKRGRRVVVLDDGPLAGGETARTTAHLSNAIDDRYTEIESIFGAEGARLAAESHTAAIEFIERTVRTEAIECDFKRVDGYLFLGPGQKEKILNHELKAAHRAGLTEVEKWSEVPQGSFHFGPCLRFPRQARFHPLHYLRALAEAIRKNGGQLFTHTHAVEMKGGAGSHRGASVVAANGATVKCSAIVVATNTPVNDRVAIHTKQAPYRTYVISAPVPFGRVRDALYWDTLDPYHYVRLEEERGRQYLIAGGEDHKTGHAHDTGERFVRLERWARERFPIGDVENRWSGQVMETFDGLAFIGRNPLDSENVYIVTGDSGMGMTHGAIAGLLLSDLITGRENPWTKLYDPARKTRGLSAFTEWLKDNLSVGQKYVELVTPGEVNDAAQISPGEGAVMRRGALKAAIYRDSQGGLHERSAICPHLGCVVDWNSTEKSWDCPCHGSRFDAFGRVVNGPANRGLYPIAEEKAA